MLLQAQGETERLNNYVHTLLSVQSHEWQRVDSSGAVCMKDKQTGSLHDFSLQTGSSSSLKKQDIGRYKERLRDSECIFF